MLAMGPCSWICAGAVPVCGRMVITCVLLRGGGGGGA